MILLPAASASTVENSNLIRRAVVTSQRGSWKYQDAFRIATYAPAVLKNGKVVWRSQGQSSKYSAPQLRRLGWNLSECGSLHNVPLTVAELAQLAD